MLTLEGQIRTLKASKLKRPFLLRYKGDVVKSSAFIDAAHSVKTTFAHVPWIWDH